MSSLLRLRPLVLATGLVASFSFGGCDTTVAQCLSEAECLSKGAGFENTTCDVATKTCVPVGDAVGSCKTNAECIAGAAGQAAICRKSDKKCVTLQTAECPDLLVGQGVSRVTDDHAIVIGYLGLQNAAPLGVQHLRSAKLAQEDFTTSVKGIPSFDGSGVPRPVVIVGCNEILTGDQGLANATNHLVKDLQVPLIIGPVDGADLLGARSGVIASNTMLLLTSTEGGGPSVPAPLFWGMTGSFDSFLAGYVAGVAEVVKRAVVKGIKAPGDPLRVLIVQENTAEGARVGPYLLEHLVFDGVKASEHDATTLRVVDMGNPVFDPITTPAPFTYEATHVLPAAFALKPHIIIHAGGSGAYPVFVIDPIESQWDASTGGAPRPIHYAYSQGVPAVLPLVLGGNPTLINRVFVADNVQLQPPNPTRLTEFVARYNNSNPDVPLTTNSATQLLLNAYDSVYLAEFALTAVGNAPLTGVNTANAMLKLAAGGPDVTDDPATIVSSLSTLAGGGTVTLDGLGARFTFDPKSGSPPGSSATFCLKYDAATNSAVPYRSGISYDGTQGKQIGTWDTTVCP